MVFATDDHRASRLLVSSEPDCVWRRSSDGQQLLASETLVRATIVTTLVSTIVVIPLLLALYRLLSGVNKDHALLMVGFYLVTVPIIFVSVVYLFGALELMHGANSLSAFQTGQLQALAMLYLNLYSQSVTVTTIFFGLWLLPLGVLVYRSTFIPRILGILLIANGLAYVTSSVVSLLSLPYANGVSSAALVFYFGEPIFVAWLLIKGVKAQPVPVLSP